MHDQHDSHLSDDLIAYVLNDPALSAEDRAAVEQHLASCAHFRAELAQTRRVLRALDTPGLAPSARFDTELYARLDRIDDERRIERARPWSRLRHGVVGALTAAAAIALFMVLPTVSFGPGTDAMGLKQIVVLEIAKDLPLYADYELLEHLDALENFEMIRDFENGGPG